MKVKARTIHDEPVTQKVLSDAIARGEARRRFAPDIKASRLQYLPESESLLIGFSDQSAVILPVKDIPELAALPEPERDRLELGFGGIAICLDEHDLHIFIAGLIAANDSLMQMATTLVAKRNGSRRSEAKAAASRENGRKGGRPPNIPSQATIIQDTPTIHFVLEEKQNNYSYPIYPIASQQAGYERVQYGSIKVFKEKIRPLKNQNKEAITSTEKDVLGLGDFKQLFINNPKFERNK